MGYVGFDVGSERDRTTVEEVLVGHDRGRNNMILGNEMKRKDREKEILKLLD
jgi:hypothetical protein